MQNKCNLDLTYIKRKVTNNSCLSSDPHLEISSNDNLQYSAVLIPLIIQYNEVKLLFTLRANSLNRHGGQVSFPGGFREKGDASPVETALRETQEEIGICKENIKVIGCLSPLNTSNENIVFPVIGIINSAEKLFRNQDEVEKIFFIPLSWLCIAEHSRVEDFIAKDGKIRKAWFFDQYEGELVWGITAKIIHDFLEVIKK
jgi:8-oxo-dGTP pyrophosphatase MutT (NUDIX family)